MKRFRTALLFLFFCALWLLVIEGLGSALVVGHTAWRVLQPFDERVQTTHDPDPGWVSLPSLARPAMYGPGAGLSIDADLTSIDSRQATIPLAGTRSSLRPSIGRWRRVSTR